MTTDNLSTLDLVANAQGGDRVALDALFARCLPRVTRIVALRCGRSWNRLEELDDVVQDSLLDAFRNLSQFEPRSEGSFLNWLAKLSCNNLNDAARRGNALKRGGGAVRSLASNSTTTFSASLLSSDESTPSEIAMGAEIERKLEAAFRELSERHRQVIDLRRMCGMSFEEIAVELGLGGESSARSLFSRAMGELSARL